MYGSYTALTLKARWPLRRRLLPPDDPPEGAAGASTSGDLASLLLRRKVLYGYYYLRPAAVLTWNPHGRYRRAAVSGTRWGGWERRCLCCSCCGGGGGGGQLEAAGLLSGVGQECCGETRCGCVGNAESCWEGNGFAWEAGFGVGECGMAGSRREEVRGSGTNVLVSAYGSSNRPSRSEGGRWETLTGGFGEGVARRRAQGSRKEAVSSKTSRKQANDVVEFGVSSGMGKDDNVEDSVLRVKQERLREENRRLREDVERKSRALEVSASVGEENRMLREDMERVSRASEVKERVTQENRRLRGEIERVLRALEVNENVSEENTRLREDMEKVSRVSEVNERIIEENTRLRGEIERILRVLEVKENITEESMRLRGEVERMLKASEVKESITEENKRLREEIERMLRVSEVKESITVENRRMRGEINRMLRASEVKESIVEENMRLREEVERLSRTKVNEDVEVQHRRLLEELERLSRTSEVKSNTSEEKRMLLDEIRRITNAYEVKGNFRVEDRRLREEMERISKTVEVNENIMKNTRYEEIKPEVKVGNNEDTSALTASLLEEVARQRQEINHLRENYEALRRRSEVQDSHVVEAPASDVASSSRMEGQEVICSSLTSLIEELRRQSMVIEQLSRSYHELAASSQITKSCTERVSSSEKIFISQLRDREKISSSTVTLIKVGKDQPAVNSQKVSGSSKASLSETSSGEESENMSRDKYAGEVGGQCRQTGQYRQDIQTTGSSILAPDSNLSSTVGNPLSDEYRQDVGTTETTEQHGSEIQLTYTSGKESASSKDNRMTNLIFSEDCVFERRAAQPGTTSALSITDLHDKEEEVCVDEHIKTSSNYSYTEESVADSLGRFTDSFAVASIQDVDKQKDELFQGSITVSSTSSGESDTSYISAETHQQLDEQTRAEYISTHDTLESANRFSASSSHYVGEVMETMKHGIESLIDVDASSGSSGIHLEEALNEADQSSVFTSGADEQKYIKEESTLAEMKGPSDEIWDLSGAPKVSLIEDTAETVLSEVLADSISVPATSENVTTKRSGRSLWGYVADIIRAGWRPRVTSQTSVVEPGTGSSSNELSIGSDAYVSGHAQNEEEDEQTEKRKRIIKKRRDPSKRSTAKESATQSRRSYNRGSITEVEALVTIETSVGVDRSQESPAAVGFGDTVEGEEVEHGGLSVPQAVLSLVGTSDGVEISTDSSIMLGSDLRNGDEMKGDISSTMQSVDLSAGCLSSSKQKTDSTMGDPSSAKKATDLAAGGISPAAQAVDLAAGGVSFAMGGLGLAAGGISSAMGAVGLSTGGISSAMQVIGSAAGSAMSTGGIPSSMQEVGLAVTALPSMAAGGVSSISGAFGLAAGGISSAIQAAGLAAPGGSSAMAAEGLSPATGAVGLSVGGISSALRPVGSAEGGVSAATQAVDLSPPMEAVDSSSPVNVPLLAGLELEIAEIDKASVSIGGNVSMGKESLKEGSLEIVESEVKDGDLRRRKLQRAKQVPREQFDEWEETHRLESEQRKLDEFFMKEALLEAQKAAASWEVPIGAVLVRDGKVIARGSNMVEELRDSTAHAEMICIREASTHLKSWRLSETTLYVTLEPCAMCAGAILQARIDTVVWGAPNKLLGADGSWVRLFPGGDEGSSEASSQSTGPVHPFHPKITIRRGILEKECADAMQQFFQLRRKDSKDDTKEEKEPSRTSASAYPTKIFSKMHNIFTMMFCL